MTRRACVTTLAWCAGLLGAVPVADAQPIGPKPTLEVSFVRSEVRAGEPVQRRVVLRNSTGGPIATVDEIPYYWNESIRPKGGAWTSRSTHFDPAVGSAPPPLAVLPPGEVRVLRDGGSSFVAEWQPGQPGDYEVSVEVGFFEWVWDAPRPATLFTGQVTSEPVPLRILAPEGIDKEAYDAFARRPLADRGSYDVLLERFPTSIYAGYALLSSGRLATWPEYALQERDGVRDRARQGEFNESDRAYDEKLRASAARSIALIPAFLAAHPDFVLEARLRLRLAGALAYFERYEEAKTQCEVVLRKPAGGREAKSAEAFLALAREKGYLPREAGR
ncbi:MAG: hypothetical protein AB1625_09630 [Acidobacteriota bacterium]